MTKQNYLNKYEEIKVLSKTISGIFVKSIIYF